jgi:hypothetical protein
MSNERVLITETNEAAGHNEDNYIYRLTLRRLFSNHLVIVDNTAEITVGRTKMTLSIDRGRFAKLAEAGLVIKPLTDAFKLADAKLTAYDQSNNSALSARADVADMPRLQVTVVRHKLF